MAGFHDTITTDGRSLRRARNRDAVLDAVIEAFEDGDIDPSVDSIADRAGVSNRSIYRYFDHRDQLIRAAVGHAMRRSAPDVSLTEVGVGSFSERVDRFVDHCLEMHAKLGPVTRAGKLAAVNEPIVEEEFEAGRLMMRQTFFDHFSEELNPLLPGVRCRAVIAAQVAFQFDAFEFLHKATDGRIEEMRAILVDHLHLSLGRFQPAHSI